MTRNEFKCLDIGDIIQMDGLGYTVISKRPPIPGSPMPSYVVQRVITATNPAEWTLIGKALT